MLIAGSLLGVVGAILAVPFAAVIKILLHEAGAPRRARMASLRAGQPGYSSPGMPVGAPREVAAPEPSLEAPARQADE